MNRSVAAALVVLSVSCADRSPPSESAALGGDIVARVGGTTIPVAVVAKVAKDQKVEPREALRRLVDDAIAAEAARAQGLDRRSPQAWLVTAARARFTAERWSKDARAKGPPSDEEVAELSRQYWREIDRPAAVRVVHAVAMRPKTGDSTPARDVAEAIRRAVQGATSSEDFMTRASEVAHPGVDVVVQELPAVTADGRLTTENGQLDVGFSRGAHTLVTPGETSGIVESAVAGFHVIRLIEKIPPRVMPLEERRVALALEAYDVRARVVRDARVEALRKSHPVAIENGAEVLMRSVSSAAP